MTAPACDIDRLMSVMDAAFDPAFGEAWTRRQVEDALLVGNCHYFLANSAGLAPEPDESAAAFAMTRTSFDEEELLLFAVVPQARRRGLGLGMLTKVARQARDRGANRLLLEMREGNPAESLYRKFGFGEVGRRPDYYRTPGGSRFNAITFAKSL